ncbi:hypothetical protein cand_016490 [Cryptosporidium andersoni]|uniref:Methyltransferase small domain-containing protein n=1 Tax=Cryptosporidium andersoni TaxID=117008 RepID=A0A1J4MTA8_9CRYT|nr:hypothetical protein cand_016490 [Cryptosporidium andersoni]
MVDLSHTSYEDWTCVYEPSDDTFFLEDTLKQETEIIVKANPAIICEVGCGSGYISSSILKELNKRQIYPLTLLTDINKSAINLAKRTITHNNISSGTEFINMELFDSFRNINRSKLNNGILDLIIFNPPYVPCLEDELIQLRKQCNIDVAWAGGLNGLEVINRFLFGKDNLYKTKLDEVICLYNILSYGGLCYLLLEGRNKPIDIINLLRQNKNYIGWNIDIINEKKISGEHLYIVKLIKRLQ